MRPASSPFLPLLVGGLLLLGTCGCAGPQATHHSGQTGRFYGEGVSFSVPQVSRADKPGAEDRYWELRRGIDRSVVVAFKPMPAGQAGFRENVVLTVQELDRPYAPAEFRDQQAADLKASGNLVGQPEVGEDASGPWLGFSRQEEGQPVVCRAWFFTTPGEPPARPRGFVLLGTAKSGSENQGTLEQFTRVAATFRTGRPPTGFELLGSAVDQAVAALVAEQPESPAAVPQPAEATARPGAAPSPATSPAPQPAVP